MLMSLLFFLKMVMDCLMHRDKWENRDHPKNFTMTCHAKMCSHLFSLHSSIWDVSIKWMHGLDSDDDNYNAIYPSYYCASSFSMQGRIQ
jgi:hypothetical protein